MFSLDRFYHILHDNLVSHFSNGTSYYFFPFGTYNTINVLDYPRPNETRHSFEELMIRKRMNIGGMKGTFDCYFYDQEPLFPETHGPIPGPIDELYDYQKKIVIIANSEKSEFKNEFVKRNKYQHDWYYFFHGFAALDWYRDFQYYDSKSFEQFDKVFICFNHLISNYRSYRLHLVSNLVENDIVDKGYVSFFLKDQYGTWQDSVNDPNSLLCTEAKGKIVKNLSTVSEPMIIDTDNPNGSLSADVSLYSMTRALWHVVTETIYFQPKLHLTEKTFKPIVSKRPFILVAAPGNLAYLKSYGFKTFDRWIDESYDNETDNFKRIEMITTELDKLCKLSKAELKEMHQEMQEVLEYNYQHFFGNFKKLIVDELVDNFLWILARQNNGRMPNNHSRYHERYEFPEGHIAEVKRRLMQ